MRAAPRTLTSATGWPSTATTRRTIEPKWQEVWERERTWEVSNDDDGGAASPTCSRCCPYPSGEPHMGHLKNYSVGDAVAHFHRRTGLRVLHPMGYDAFGLPAENNAIKTGEHPRESTAESIAPFQQQFRSLGHLDRLVARVRHARAALLPLDPVDLPAAVRARAGLPQGGRGQLVPEGRRPCSPTSRSSTAAASAAARRSRCASSSSGSSASPTTPTACSTTSTTIEWPQHVKTMQRNWIGRSEGAEVTFSCPEIGVDYPVFTTRPDTLFGATFFVMAPGAPRRAPARRRHRARAGGPRVRQPRARPRADEERADDRAQEDRRPAGAHASSTRSTASGSRCSSPTTC